MTMTNAEIIALARMFVGDSGESPYPADEEAAKLLDQAKQALLSKTGTCLIADDESLITLAATPAGLTGNCELDARWKEHLARYTAAMMASMPGANNDPEKAAAELARFNALFGGR
jgi:hypothetical protein